MAAVLLVILLSPRTVFDSSMLRNYKLACQHFDTCCTRISLRLARLCLVDEKWKEKKRARETACWHHPNNMHYFALAVFVMPSRSRAINLAGEPLIHFVRGFFSALLDCDASMRNVK